jgi:hypothetical protein
MIAAGQDADGCDHREADGERQDNQFSFHQDHLGGCTSRLLS